MVQRSLMGTVIVLNISSLSCTTARADGTAQRNSSPFPFFFLFFVFLIVTTQAFTLVNFLLSICYGVFAAFKLCRHLRQEWDNWAHLLVGGCVLVGSHTCHLSLSDHIYLLFHLIVWMADLLQFWRLSLRTENIAGFHFSGTTPSCRFSTGT